MPIKPEFRKFYGPVWRNKVRPAILRRAGNKCEQCRKPDRMDIFVIEIPTNRELVQFWRRAYPGSQWIRCSDGADSSIYSASRPYRLVRVVLTIAHLNHISGDDRDENLKALCQWCHLNYDKVHHAESRASRKDAARPLLAEKAS